MDSTKFVLVVCLDFVAFVFLMMEAHKLVPR